MSREVPARVENSGLPRKAESHHPLAEQREQRFRRSLRAPHAKDADRAVTCAHGHQRDSPAIGVSIAKGALRPEARRLGRAAGWRRSSSARRRWSRAASTIPGRAPAPATSCSGIIFSPLAEGGGRRASVVHRQGRSRSATPGAEATRLHLQRRPFRPPSVRAAARLTGIPCSTFLLRAISPAQARAGMASLMASRNRANGLETGETDAAESCHINSETRADRRENSLESRRVRHVGSGVGPAHPVRTQAATIWSPRANRMRAQTRQCRSSATWTDRRQSG